MSKVDELLEHIPDELKPIAIKYIPILIKLTIHEIRAWVELLIKGDWQTAYAFVVSRMTTEDLLSEQKRINREFAELNDRNAEFIDIQKAIAKQLLEVALTVLVVA